MIPESVLKKQKSNEERALAKKQEVDAKKKNSENWKLIYSRGAGDTHSFISYIYIFFFFFSFN